MTTFLDGPAAGVTLFLRRAPFLLRVVQSHTGEWDALDQLTDQPGPQETIAVYRLARAAGTIHLCARGKGAQSGTFAMAEYRLHEVQPADATARSIRAWRTWCDGQVKQLHKPEPEER